MIDDGFQFLPELGKQRKHEFTNITNAKPIDCICNTPSWCMNTIINSRKKILFWHLWRMSWESSRLNKRIHWLLQKQQTTCTLPLVSLFLPHDHCLSRLWQPRMCAKNLKAHYCPISTKNNKLANVEHLIKTWMNLYRWKMKGL